MSAVLLAAAWAKIRAGAPFRAALKFLVPSLGESQLAAVVGTVIVTECVVAGAFVSGLMVEYAAWVGVCFLLAATVVLLVLRRRGYQGGCGCFGEHGGRGDIGSLGIFRNTVLILVTLGVAIQARGNPEGSSPLWTLSLEVWALGGATIVGMMLSYTLLDSMVNVATAAKAATKEETASLAVRGVP